MRAARVLAAVAGVAWLATMAAVFAGEVLGGDRHGDVEALVEAARLGDEHASARYLLRVGGVTVGELRSSVSGAQREDQLAYVLRGQLRSPQRIELEGFVLADWERRPERFVFEARVSGATHRVTGGLAARTGSAGGLVFTATHDPPGGAERTGEWVLPQSPILAPGPLPVPELQSLPGGRTGGAVATPFGGAPLTWTLETETVDAVRVGGRRRAGVRHRMTLSSDGAGGLGVPAVVEWVTEPSGFPLRVSVGSGDPPRAELVLVEESR